MLLLLVVCARTGHDPRRGKRLWQGRRRGNQGRDSSSVRQQGKSSSCPRPSSRPKQLGKDALFARDARPGRRACSLQSSLGVGNTAASYTGTAGRGTLHLAARHPRDIGRRGALWRRLPVLQEYVLVVLDLFARVCLISYLLPAQPNSVSSSSGRTLERLSSGKCSRRARRASQVRALSGRTVHVLVADMLPYQCLSASSTTSWSLRPCCPSTRPCARSFFSHLLTTLADDQPCALQ